MVRKLAIFIVVFIVCSLAFLPFSAIAVTMTIQPPSQDSLINKYYPENNYGSAVFLVIGMGPGDYIDALRTLVQFDLSSIPLGSAVSSATLMLYYYYAWQKYNYDPAGDAYWAYRVTQSWTESGVTWRKRDGINLWTTEGGDYTTTGGASATVPASYSWMTWDVTNIVKAWIEEGQSNYGFLIRDVTPSIALTYFFSREYTENTALRPILEVTYTPPSLIPEFSLPLVAVVSTAAIILFLHKRKLSPTLPH